jgi:hypothetical protein
LNKSKVLIENIKFFADLIFPLPFPVMFIVITTGNQEKKLKRPESLIFPPRNYMAMPVRFQKKIRKKQRCLSGS